MGPGIQTGSLGLVPMRGSDDSNLSLENHRSVLPYVGPLALGAEVGWRLGQVRGVQSNLGFLQVHPSFPGILLQTSASRGRMSNSLPFKHLHLFRPLWRVRQLWLWEDSEQIGAPGEDER